MNMTRRFTGWHAAGILIAFFGTVMAVNLTMATYATSTFGGVVVKNSYVASQEFNRWLDQAAKSEALGWHAEVSRRPDGRIAIALSGAPQGTALSGMAWHPLGRSPDEPLSFQPEGEGAFTSREALPAGRWVLRLEARAGEDLWRAEEELQ